jgi:hypothetical protein
LSTPPNIFRLGKAAMRKAERRIMLIGQDLDTSIQGYRRSLGTRAD